MGGTVWCNAMRGPKSLPNEPNDIRTTLSELVQLHTEQKRPFSAWQCHCLSQAMNLLRFGSYDQAREWIMNAARPPNPLPIFALPRTVTVEQVRQAIAEAQLPRL